MENAVGGLGGAIGSARRRYLSMCGHAQTLARPHEERAEEAIAWLKRCPNPLAETAEVEIRPLFEETDFAG